ncbi:MAG: tetratricopeptide repeat protein [Acaryochloridaceae cyanobacterium SU_2_1]|nr:tetratricopeptide repeat protein [Acaryochloridaceae cyanobacterium SU_2_1]
MKIETPRFRLWLSTLLLGLAFLTLGESHLRPQAVLAQSPSETPNQSPDPAPTSLPPTPETQPIPAAADLKDATPAGTKQSEELNKLSVTEAVTLGDQHYAQGDYDSAVAAYSHALQSFELHAYALYNRGNAYRQLENYRAAIADFTKSLKIDPDNNFAYLYRGMALLGDQQADAAISDFNHLIERNFKLPLAYHKRGEGYMIKANYQAAPKT